MKKTDRLAVSKLIFKYIKQSLRSPYAVCMLVSSQYLNILSTNKNLLIFKCQLDFFRWADWITKLAKYNVCVKENKIFNCYSLCICTLLDPHCIQVSWWRAWSVSFLVNEWMCIYIPHISHIVSRRFTILIECDRTSACKGASGCHYQFIFDLTRPPNPCMKCEMKLQMDHNTGNYVYGFFNAPC